MRRVAIWAASILVVLISAYSSFMGEVSWDVGYICENTGSWYGYRLWLGGRKTHVYSRKSSLEQYLESNHPDIRINHRWTRMAFMGRNVWGEHISYSDGPHGGMVSFRDPELKEWINHHSDNEILDLHSFLCTADFQQSSEMIGKIQEGFRREPR